MKAVPGMAELRARCQPSGLDVCLYRRVFVRRFSIYVTREFIRTGVSADSVSAAKGVMACAGSLLFYTGKQLPCLAGALLLQISFILDACDGEVARYTGTCRKAGGEYIDKLGDAASRGLFYGAWGYAVHTLEGSIQPVIAGAVMAGTWLVVRFCSVETVLESISNHPDIPPGGEEMEAVGRLFVRKPCSGRIEYLLSMLFHPWTNLAALVAVSFLTPFYSILFWAYAILWAVNTARKTFRGYTISNFTRPGP